MKFFYKKVGKLKTGQDAIRPIIPIKLKSGYHEVRYEVLVDSGADICVIDAELAELLGLKLTAGKPDTFVGVTGVHKMAYIHKIEMEIGGWTYPIEVLFAPGLSQFGYGIVGQRSFFEFFKVIFDYRKGEIEIKKN